MAGRMVEFESNGATAGGYLATPPSGSGPGVIVIQEWWGLNDQIEGVADRFASEGFTALAPDFYHGRSAKIGEPDEAGKLMMALNIEQAGKDARGAARFLAGETGGPVGVIGFCMGGQLALFAGTVAPDDVAAVVNCYGIHPAVQPDFSKMRAAVLCLFAGEDGFVDEAARKKVEEQCRAAGVTYDSHVYPAVDHAFMNEQRADAYDKESAEDAWARALALFRAQLG